MAQLYKIGSYGTDDITTIIQLVGFISTDGNVTHLRLPFTTSGYQVTVGKTLYMVRMLIEGTGNAGWWKAGYADNDVGYNTATARTNPVMAFGTDDTNNNGRNYVPVSLQAVDTTAGMERANHLWKLAASAKFPFFRRVGAVPNDTVMVWCVEL